MKTSAFALVALLLVMRSPQLNAAGTNAATASAFVAGQCKVTSPPGTLNFGSIDPSGGVNVTATTSFSMKCTKGTLSSAATDNGGSNFAGTKRMKHSATPTVFLPYAVAYGGDSGFTGQGFGVGAAAHTVTVTGTITPAQFQNALVTVAGQQYSDTVTITVNP
jgi:spore coat protein U-like protein